MLAGRIAGIAIYFTVGAFNRSTRRNFNLKVIIFSFRIATAFVKAGVYSLCAIQNDIALVFFIFKSQAISSPAAECCCLFLRWL